MYLIQKMNLLQKYLSKYVYLKKLLESNIEALSWKFRRYF